MIELEVNSIRVNLMTQQRVILLKDINQERYLPIWIGQPEAEAITIELHEKRQSQRPFTHDLLKSVIETLGARIVHIFINDMRSEIFYARLVLESNGEQLEIDSRPSDAIALAVRFKAPIFVAESVMKVSGVEPEDEIDIYAEEQNPELFDADDFDATDTQEDESVTEVDENQLSAFSDFVNSLDLDELDDSDDN